MQTLLRILSLFQVLVCVEMKNQSGNVLTVTEGGRVEIYCNYPDGYKYVIHYFCHHPCGYSDVLIKTERADKVTSKGRYSVLNTASARSFSVTIRNLRSGDSGVYYCGVDQWGKDTLSEVVVTVRKVTPKPTAAPLSTLQTITDPSSVSTLTKITADFPANMNKQHPQHSPYILQSCKSFLFMDGCLVCSCAVRLWLLWFSTEGHPLHTQHEACHVYYEMLAVYSLAGPANMEDPSGTCSIIHYTRSTEEDCSTYSPVAPH
ncbi:CMRF35-like molecule 5 [Pygocentrus nattereri]|uniref:CMRF35-like molecule 5 n=1 Tax=Pygocentrus nattereri TaxID=42514 RepID=UPI00081492B1|nr:CMRF35-like molecule 5 [Pygocentrus nattereri]